MDTRKGKNKVFTRNPGTKFKLKPLASLVRSLAFPTGLMLGSSAALAAPQGGEVVAGQGNISTPNANTTVIDQHSHRLSLDWQSFNISANELVQFNQPSTTSSALNRILDHNPSQIFGSLRANGEVVLVNPNGVFFGPTASLSVGSLVASGLNINSDDFMAGNYNFESAIGEDGGVVVNQGILEAATGGSINLLGSAVRNEGLILATAGSVNLVAGKAVTMDFDGDGLIQFAIDQEVLSNVHDLDSAISNSGEISAEGGSVLMHGRAAQDVFTNVVNNEGIVRAGRIENSGGVIRLVAGGNKGTVINTGTLDASSENGTGGAVHVLGDRVGLFEGSSINVSGSDGGGTVLVGGDFQGANPDIQNASQTIVHADTSINASATGNGDGGKVIIWADGATSFAGVIESQGGQLGGDGGLVEVSGKNHLSFHGDVSTSAELGNTGTLLLDPKNIIIQDGGAGTAVATVNFADGADPGPLDSIFDADDLAALDTNIILQANNDITFDEALTLTNDNLTAQAGRSIFVNQDINSGGGDVNLTANDAGATAAERGSGDGIIAMADGVTIDAGGGNINLATSTGSSGENGGDILIENLTTSGAGDVTLTSDDGSIIGTSGDHLISADQVSLNSLTAADQSVGTADDAINTSANVLTGTAGTGGFFVDEANAVTISGVNVTGAGEVQVSNTTADISLDDGTAISSGGGDVTVTADAGSILDSTPGAETGAQISTTGAVILDASFASIGATGDGDIDIDSSTQLEVLASGNIVVSSSSDLDTLTVTAVANNNEHSISATNLTSIITDDANDFTLLDLNDTTGLSFTFVSGNGVSGDGDINVGLIDVSGGAGDVILASSSGAINDATGANQVRDIIVADGSFISLLAEDTTSGAIGSGNAIDVETQQLFVISASDIEVDVFDDDAGTGKDLTALGIEAFAGNNTHSINTTAQRVITIVDDATDFTQLSVDSVGGPPPAMDFSFTAANTTAGQGDIAIDIIESENGDVAIVSTAGAISDFSSGDTVRDIIAGSGAVALLADSVNSDVGVAGETLEVDTAILSIDAGNDFDVAVVADDAGTGRDLSQLEIIAVANNNTHSLTALNLTNTITDNATDFTELSLSDSSNLDFAFTAANATAAEGDIAVGLVDVTNGAVFITSTAGAITDLSSGDTTRDIIAGTGLIELTADSVNGDVGAAGEALEVDTANLVIDSGNDITVDVVSDDAGTGRDLSDLTITAVAGSNSHALTAGGGLTLGITDDATDFTDISATGDAALNFAFRSGNAGAGEGDITIGSISVGTGNVTLISADNGDTGIASAAGAGTDIATTGNIEVEAGAGSIGAVGNLLEVTANNTFTGIANSGAIHVQNNTNIALDFTGETDLSDVVATDVFEFTVAGLGTLQYLTTDDLSVSATGAAGSISSSGATIAANNLALNTASGTINVDTDANAISVAGSGGNDVTISNSGTDGNTTFDVATGGAGNIDLTQLENDLLVGALSTTADVTLDSDQGNIDDATADSVTDITATNLNMTALQGIGANAELDVDANLAAIDSNGGDIDILGSGAGATTISGLVDSGGGNITISDNDGITVDDPASENTTETLISSNGGDITLDADLDDNGAGTFTIDDQIDSGSGGNIDIFAADYSVEDDADLETAGGGDATLNVSAGAASFGLGDGAIGMGQAIDFADAQMDQLVVSGTLTIGDTAAGSILLDRESSFGANNLTLISGSTIDDVGTDNALETTGTLTMTSNGDIGAAAGSGGDGLSLDVGAVVITSTNDNNVIITDSGAGGDTNYQIGTDGGDVIGDVTIVQTTNNMTLGSGGNQGINAQGNSVTLTVSGGSIVDNNAGTTDITATSLDITDVLNIGDLDDVNDVLVAAIDSIETDIDTLTNVVLRAGGEGAISNNGALAITAFDLATAGSNASLQVVASGTIDAGTTTFNGINSGDSLGLVASAGNVEIPDAAIDLGTGNLRLDASAGDLLDNTDSDLSNNLFSADTILVASNTAESIDISAVNLEAHITGAGNGLIVTEADAINLLDVDTFDGSIMVTAMGTITAMDVVSTNNSNTATNDITLVANTNATDDILVTTITANGNAGVVLTAMDDILDTNTTDANVLTANDLTATATSATADTDGITLDTDITSVTASVVTNAGDINIVDNSGITLTDIDTANGAIDVSAAGAITATDVISTGGSITLTSTAAGDITVGAINSATTVNIDAASGAGTGSIKDSANDATVDITATGLITLDASADIDGGFADDFLDLAAGSTVDATSDTAGEIRLAGIGGAIILQDVDTASGDIEVTSAGAITATDVISVGGSTTLTSTAAGDISIGAIDSATTVNIDAGTGSILDAANDAVTDITAGGLITLDATADINRATGDDFIELAAGSTVDVSSTTAGEIKLAGAGSLELQDVDTANGEIEIIAAGAITATDVAATGGEIAITSTAAGDITVGVISATAEVTLDAGTGSIKDSANDATIDITAGGLITLDATADIDGGFADDRLELAGGSTVDATSSASGEIKLAGIGGGIVLQAVDTTSGLIDITAAGAMTVNSVNAAGGTVRLQSTAAGAITLDDTNGGGGVITDDTGASAVVIINDDGDILDADTGTADDLAAAQAIYNIQTGAGATVTMQANSAGSSIGGTTPDHDDIDINNAKNVDFSASANVLVQLDPSGATGLDSATFTVTPDGVASVYSVRVVGGTNISFSESTAGLFTISDISNSGNMLDFSFTTLGPTGGATISDIVLDSSGGTAIEDINGGTVTLNANGSIGDANDDTVVDIDTSGLITLVAQDEIQGDTQAGGFADNAIELIAGATVDASSTTAGDINLAGAGALTVQNATTANGALNVTAAGTVTVTNADTSNTDNDANDVTITTTTGDIDVTNIAAGTLGDVFLDSDNGAVDGAGGGPHISAGDLTIDATTGIGAGTQLSLSGVDLLDVDTANGNIDITNANAGATTNILSATTGNGNIDIATTGAGADITIENGAIVADTVDDVVTINASGAIDDAQANPDTTTDITAFSIDLDAADGIGGTADVDIAATQVDADVSGTGDIDLNEADAVTLTSLSTNNGAISVAAGGAVTVTSVDSSNTDNDANDVTITTTTGDIDVTSIAAGALGDVILDTDAGAVDGAGAGPHIAAGDVTIDATTGIGSGTQLSLTGVDLLDVDTTAGNIDITNADAGGTTNVASATTTDGNIDIATTGAGADITIENGAIVADTVDDVVTISAGGAIDDAQANPDTTTDITAFSIDLDAADGIGATADVDIAGSTLDAAVSAAGNVVINETDGITLNDLSTNNGAITVAAGGAVAVTSVDSSNTDNDANDVTITTTTGDIDVTSINSGTLGDVLLDTDNGAVDGAGGGPHITAGDLTIDVINGIGNVTQLSLAGVDLLDVDTLTGNIDITNANAGGTTNIASATTGNGDIDIATTGAGADITIENGAIMADVINDVVTINASGAIDDAQGLDTTADITATSIDLDAVDGIGGTAGVDLATNDVDADVSGAGDIDLNVDNSINITLTSLSTNNGAITVDGLTGSTLIFVNSVDTSNTDDDANDVSISGSAVIDVSNINAGTLGDVFLLSGGIVNGFGAGPHITAGDLTIDATTGIGSGTKLSLTGVDLLDVDTANGNIDITNANAGATTNILSATTGNGNIDIATTGAGADITIDNGAIVADTVDDVVTINASGAIDDAQANPDTTTDITAFSIDLDAADGIGGTANVDIAATQVDADVSAAGDIDLNEADAVTLTSLSTNNGAITVAAGGAVAVTSVDSSNTNSDTNDVSITTTTGDIDVTSIAAGALGDVLLDTDNGAVDGAGGGPHIAAGDLTIDATTGIGAGTQLSLSGVDLLDVDTTAGNIDVTNANAGATTNILSATTTDGNIDIATTGAGADITIENGAIAADTVDDVVTINSSGAIDDAQANPDTSTDITAFSIDLDAVDGIGGTADVDVAATNLDADVSGTGDIDLNEADVVTLTSLSTNNGAITVAAGGAVTVTSVDSSNTNSDANDVTITTTTGDIDVTNIAAGTLGDVILDTDNGAVDGAGGGPHIAAGDLTIDATTGIGAGTQLSLTGVDLLNVDTTAGNIDITNLNAGDTTNVASAMTTDGNIDIATTGAGADITIDNGAIMADTTDDVVTINSSGAIDDAQANPDTTTDITAFSIDLDAADGIGGTADVDIAGNTLDAAVSSAGDIVINETDGITLNDLSTNNGAITVAAGGAVAVTSVDSSNTDNDANDVTITTTTGDIDVTNIAAGTLGDVTLSTAAGAVDGAGAGPHIAAGDLSIDATTGIGSGTQLSLTGVDLLDVDTTNGNIDITNANAGAATSVASATTGNGNIDIATTGAGADITIENGAIVADTTDDVVTINSSGAIDDAQANPDTTTDITAFSIDLDAADGIGATADVDTSVAQMDLNVTGTGAIVINEANASTVSSAITNDGNITINGGGDMELDTVTAGGANTINLNTSAGDITDTDGNSNLTANNIDLDAAGGIGSAVNNINTNTTAMLTLVSGGANAAGDIFINEGNSLNTSQLAVTTNTGSEQTVSISANDITVDGALGNSQDALSLSATGGSIVDGGATLTATTLTLDVSATNGATIGTAGANNEIETDADVLSVDASNGAGGIFINEVDDIDLALVDSGTGPFEISTNGNLTDSGTINVGGATNIDTNGNDVDLDNADGNNDFVGDVTFTNVNDVNIEDVNAIQFTATTIGGDFDVSSGGNITDNGTLMVTGITTLDAGGSDIIFDNVNNDFMSTVNVSNTNDLTIDDTNTLSLGTVTTTNDANIDAGDAVDFTGLTTVGGNLVADTTANGAGGTITDTGGQLDVTGTTTLVAAGNDITLDNNSNDFGGDVIITSGNNVDIQDTDNISFGASTIAGNFNVTSGGNMIDNGTLMVTGITTLDAGGNDVIFNDPANDFMSAVNAANVNTLTIDDANTLTVGTVTSTNNVNIDSGGAVDFTGVVTVGNNLDVDTDANGAGGTITDTGGQLLVTGTSTLDTAGNDITLDNNTNDFGGDVIITSGNNVEIQDSDNVSFGASTIGGNFDVTSGGDITDNGTLLITGITTLDAGGNNITLNDVTNDFMSAVNVSNTNNLTIDDVNALTLGTVTTGNNVNIDTGGTVDFTGVTTVGGNLDVDTTLNAGGSGPITDSGGQLLIIGTTMLEAGANAIALDEDSNDFQGAVSASNSGGNDVTIHDENDLTIDTITAGNNLVLNFDRGADDSSTLDLSNAMVTAGGAATLDGQGTNDSILMTDTANTWTITGANSGTINDGTLTYNFTDLGNLEGNNDIDNFVFNGGTISGTVDGGTGAGANTLDYSGVAGPIDIVLTAPDTNGFAGTGDNTGGFANITDLTGSGNAADTLTGDDADATWTLQAGDDTYASGGEILTIANGTVRNFVGGSAVDTFDINSANTNNLAGADGNDLFNFNNGTLTGQARGNAGNDIFNLNGGSLTASINGGPNADAIVGGTSYTITGANSGNNADIGGGWTSVENLAGTVGDDTFVFTTGTISGIVDGLGGNDTLDFSGAGAQVIRITSLGTTDGFAGTTTASDFDNVNSVTGSANTDTLVNGSSADSTFNIENGDDTFVAVNTLTFSDVENLGGGSGDDTFNFNGDHAGQVTGGAGDDTFNHNSGTLTGDITGALGINIYSFGNGEIAGSVIIEGNDIWYHNDGIPLGNSVTGTGTLTVPNSTADTPIIDPAAGNDLVIDSTGLNLPDLTGFTGHIIIGGFLSPPNLPVDGDTRIQVNTDLLTLDENIVTNSDVTLLGSNVDLNADINAGGIGGDDVLIVAVGDTNGGSGPGNITAEAIPTNIEAGSLTLIANNTVENSTNLDIALDNGDLQVVVGDGNQAPQFGLLDANAIDATPETTAFVTTISGALISVGQESTAANQAGELIGLAQVAVIDVGLFEEDLTLFGSIGGGIALSLANCEEMEGCAPNVSESELAELIRLLEERIAELNRRLEENPAGEERTRLEDLLDGYEQELENFRSYQSELQDFLSDGSESEDSSGESDVPDSDEQVESLRESLSVIQKRLDWLQDLLLDPEARNDVSERTGIELSPEVLQDIIDATQQERNFLEKEIETLENGMEARIDTAPVFQAEMGHPSDALEVSYGVKGPYYQATSASAIQLP